MDKTCCVRGCKNENDEGCGVSFHSFPTNKIIRSKWYEALGFIPKRKNPTICSEHFKNADFMPSTLPPQLFDYAVPFIVKVAKTPSKLKFCRICLSMDVKLHHMKNSFLIEMYQNITGIQFEEYSEDILQYICWECTARLRAAADLREKALISDGLLHDLLKIRESKITEKDIQCIKENYSCLDSSLVTEQVFFTTESYDYPEKVSSNVEIDIVYDNNNKENEINSSNEENDVIASDTPADDIEDKEITNKILDFDDFGEEIINDSESENEDEDTKVFKDINEKVSVVDCNKKDENDGLLMGKKGVAKTAVATKSRVTRNKRRSNTAEEDKSVVDTVKEEPVEKRVKIKREKTKETTKDDNLKRRLRHTNTVPVAKRSRTDDFFASIFTITPLTHEEQIEEISKRQESEKYINAPNKCTVCYRGYTDKDRYATHLDKHSEISGDYECHICKTRLKTSRAIQSHINGQHNAEYSCTKCPFVSRFKGVAQKHAKFHAGTKYQCPHCDLVFEKYTTYMGHLRVKHVSDYVCELCGYTFVNKKGIEVHKNKRHRLDDEQVTLEGPYCEVCDVKFASEEAHDRHLRLSSKHISEQDPGVAQKHEKYHAGTKYQCPHCGSVFDQYSTYMGHLRIKHVSDYVCELCGYTFVSKKGIEVHKNAKHIFLDKTVTLEGPYCEVCDVKFASEEAHDRHLRLSSKHISEKDPSRLRNDSQHKGDGIRPRRGGVRRMMINSPVPPDCESPKPHAPVSCEQCGVELGNLALYAQHFRSIHPDKNRTKFASNTTYMCEQCGNLYHSMSSLEDHKWVHTGEKSFKCDQCPKSYAHKYYLLLHKREHNGTRESYSCHICGKQFSLYSNRQRHMLTHTDLKPYKCEICGKCFTTNSSRKNHIKHVHLRNPWPKRIRHRGKSSKCDELSAED